jgi:hypothetical protein
LINLSIRKSTPAQVEAFRRSLGPVAEALAPMGWVMTPLDPEAAVYDIIHVEFTNSTGAAMFVRLDTVQPGSRHSGFTIAMQGWDAWGRASFGANHGFAPRSVEAALRAVATAELLDDNCLGWNSTPEPGVMRLGKSGKLHEFKVSV